MVQANVEPASVAVKSNVAVAVLTVPVGPEVIVVSGGVVSVVSTVHVRVAGLGSVLFAASVAATVKVCGPSARPVKVTPLVHGAGAPPSKVQAKVDPA